MINIPPSTSDSFIHFFHSLKCKKKKKKKSHQRRCQPFWHKKEKVPAMNLTKYFGFCCLEGQVGKYCIQLPASSIQGYTERREVAKSLQSNAFQTAVCARVCVRGASFMAAAAPKPLLPGNTLACCFNKRGWFGGHKEEWLRGGREGERETDSSRLIQTSEVAGDRGEREGGRGRDPGWPSLHPHSDLRAGSCLQVEGLTAPVHGVKTGTAQSSVLRFRIYRRISA